MNELTTALAFCKTNEKLYVDMEQCISRGDAKILYASETALFMYDIPSGIAMLAGENEQELEQILSSVSPEIIKAQNGLIVSHGETVRDAVKKYYPCKDTFTACYQVVFTSKTPISLSGALRFEKTTRETLDIIEATYDRESKENLEKLSAQGKIYCAFTKDTDEFVGFIGRHPEGSMGLLLIFPEYRRHGYAEELEGYMTNVILSEGKVPYAHIIEDNYKSQNLQKKLGFDVADEKVYWQKLQ